MTMTHKLREILAAGLAAADPRAAVLAVLTAEGDRIRVGERVVVARRVVALAVGKAASAMAQGATERLGARIAGGLIVTRRGYDRPVQGWETLVAGHPTPDDGSLAAARRVRNLAASLDDGDLLLALISGGASALLADTAGDIRLDDLGALTAALLRSGASIHEINAVRKHISTLKGGGLARLASPAAVVALLLSDVVGDDPATIGSGLTTPDPTTRAEAGRVLRRYAIDPPVAIARYLEDAPETPKPGDALFARVSTTVIGSGRLSAQAAARRAAELGYTPLILSTLVTNPAHETAALYGAIVREARLSGHPVPPPCAIISGGEATVTVRGQGIGGSNQEFALALALDLDGMVGWSALSADTDGVDGPTDAAGGMVDGTTAGAIRAAGLDPAALLAANDAYRALRAGGALLVTGPTGTNVNDLRVALVD